MKMKPMSLYFPISRIDEDKRIVEGIAFANEVVDGEGGIRLRASAMKAATDDYMKYGTIRSMHQPSAAGTAVPNDPEIAALCGVSWNVVDGKDVATLRSYISDDNDWKKVKDGTYKGYSVGVAPKVMRGKNVESCTWYETSLVDRPKDPGALLTTFRVDGMPDEFEVEQLEDDKVTELKEQYTRLAGSESFTDAQKVDLLAVIERSIVEAGGELDVIEIPSVPEFNDVERGDWTKEKRDALRDEDFGWPEEKKYPVADQDDMDAATKLVGRAPESMQDKIKARLKSIAKRKDLKLPETWEDAKDEKTDDDKEERTVVPTITRADLESALAEDELIINRVEWGNTIQRVQELETKISTTEAELTRVQGLVTTAEGEIQRLKDMPSRMPPARNFGAAERVFGHSAPNPEAVKISDLQRQKQEIENTIPANQAEAEKQAAMMMRIDHQLARLGA